MCIHAHLYALYSRPAQIGCRFLIGVGVGVASCVAPLYIQELSPTRLRGRMVAVNVVAITGGQVIAYGIDAAFANTSGGWRWMVGLGAVPSGLQFIFLFFLPESREYPRPVSPRASHSPGFCVARIMIMRENFESARATMAKIYAYASPEQIDLKVRNSRGPLQGI